MRPPRDDAVLIKGVYDRAACAAVRRDLEENRTR